MSSILPAIKHERKLSLNHWRYRLLFWFFGYTTEKKHKLPSYLFTHYCPLFHLTNLIALFSPFILVWKILTFILIRGVVPAILGIVNGVEYLFSARVRRAKERVEDKVEPKAKPVNLAKLMRSYYDQPWCCAFEIFWNYSSGHKAMVAENPDIEYWEKRYNGLAAKFKMAYEKKEARAKRMRERVAFWVNLSSTLIKGLMYVGYAALFLFIVWVLWSFGAGGVWAVGYIAWWLVFGMPWVVVGKIVAVVGAVVLFTTLLVWLNKRFNWLRTSSTFVADAVIVVTYPVLGPLWAGVKAVFRGIGDGINSVNDFISIFYEENCPPIQIIDEEEEVVEQEEA